MTIDEQHKKLSKAEREIDRATQHLKLAVDSLLGFIEPDGKHGMPLVWSQEVLVAKESLEQLGGKVAAIRNSICCPFCHRKLRHGVPIKVGVGVQEDAGWAHARCLRSRLEDHPK